jgi:hypothetical protein
MVSGSAIHIRTCLGLLILGIAGCGDDLGNRQEVSGVVTLQGQPLDDGAIEFTPLESQQPDGVETKSGAPIVQGKYVIPQGQGLAPGKYRVRITAGTPDPPPQPGELPSPTFGPPPQERVPAEYNTQSRLEATVTSGANTFNFEIP